MTSNHNIMCLVRNATPIFHKMVFLFDNCRARCV